MLHKEAVVQGQEERGWKHHRLEVLDNPIRVFLLKSISSNPENLLLDIILTVKQELTTELILVMA